MEFKALVRKLNEQLDDPFKFNLDMVHQTLAVYDGSKPAEFVCYSDSIFKDTSILPHNFTWDKTASQKLVIMNMVIYINRSLFTESIERLLVNKPVSQQTIFVRLRIIINMIDKLDLRTSDKLEWQEHLRIITRIREKVFFDYYLSEIIQIPF